MPGIPNYTVSISGDFSFFVETIDIRTMAFIIPPSSFELVSTVTAVFILILVLRAKLHSVVPRKTVPCIPTVAANCQSIAILRTCHFKGAMSQAPVHERLV